MKHVAAAGNFCGSGGSRTDRSRLEIEQPFRQKLLSRIPSVWEHTNYVHSLTGQAEWVIIAYFCTFFFIWRDLSSRLFAFLRRASLRATGTEVLLQLPVCLSANSKQLLLILVYKTITFGKAVSG